MPKHPVLTSKEVIDLLTKNGFTLDRSKGSHMIYINSASRKRVVVPFHKKDLPLGTLMEILRQAGISREDIK